MGGGGIEHTEKEALWFVDQRDAQQGGKHIQRPALPRSSKGNRDVSRPHLLVLAILMTLEECGWVSVFFMAASG